MNKGNTSTLVNGLLAKLPIESRNVGFVTVQIIVIDFMALVRKLPLKKMNIITYGGFAECLRSNIINYAAGSSRIDIIFDVYNKDSIKDGERLSRGSASGITVAIRNDAQTLPEDMGLFWSSADNKVQLQHYFYKWMILNFVSEKDVFFGGVNNVYYCIKLVSGQTSTCTELNSVQEEADDRMMFHITHGCNNGIESVRVVSPDSDVFCSLVYHFKHTWSLNELYMRLGRGRTKRTVAIHSVVQKVDEIIVSNLPAIHALSGCDTTSKVGLKLACLNKPVDLSLIHNFGKNHLDLDMIVNAEKFLLQCFNKQRDAATFDDYRHEQYYDSTDFNKLVCCTSTIHEHIKRAYFQSMLWYTAAESSQTYPDPTNYGYERNAGSLIPVIISGDNIPNDLPPPCTCTTCARRTCLCRINQWNCSKFCKCSGGHNCKNPHN